jgi:adenylosuccinate lyase
MARIWSEQRKLETWLEVELAVSEALAEAGVIPAEDFEQIRDRASFDIDEVKERERITGHDVAAFVDVVGASVGEAGRWFHYGLTSSDVLDTGRALQLREAGDEVVGGARALTVALADRAREFRDTLCVGRTHGVHAEPTTFGLKLAGFAFEFDRSARRMSRAFRQLETGKLSGAVGTYSTFGPEIGEAALAKLGLKPEPVATQVVPRDRHAELLAVIAIAASSLERLAVEIRNLQRTEIREVEESFGDEQKGSSAMPHKRNPIASERITGLSRVLRGNAQTALENVALWHERDISHSSAERVIIPDSTTLLDYMQELARAVVEGMRVDPDRMLRNLELTHGALFSQSVLTALVESGLSRDDAYRIVQRVSQRAWDERGSFKELLQKDPEVASRIDGAKLEELFDPRRFVRNVPEILHRLDSLPG